LEASSSFASSSQWTPNTLPQGRAVPSYRSLCLPSTASSVTRVASKRHAIQFGVRQGLKTLSVDHTIPDTSLTVVGLTHNSAHSANPAGDMEDHLEVWVRDGGDDTALLPAPLLSPQLPSFPASRSIRVSLSSSSRSSHSSASRPVTTSNWADMTRTPSYHLETAPTTPHSPSSRPSNLEDMARTPSTPSNHLKTAQTTPRSPLSRPSNSTASSTVVRRRHITPSQLLSHSTSRVVSPHRLSIMVVSKELNRSGTGFRSGAGSFSEQDEPTVAESPPKTAFVAENLSQDSPVRNASAHDLQMLRALPQFESIMQRLQVGLKPHHSSAQSR
jgi:hypothetical protein